MDEIQIALVKAILADVKYPGYSFRVLRIGDLGPVYLQAIFTAPDNDKPGHVGVQTTRKWLISKHMTRSELVQTAFKCVLTSVEHETRERFTYKGARVFGPHFDIDALVACAMLTDTRPEVTNG